MTGDKTIITERRRMTRNRIFRFIYEAEDPVSKQEIAYALRLSMPTIHQNIAELTGAGYIRIGEIQQSTGGRRPAGYEVVRDAKVAIGVSVTANFLFLLATDLKLWIIASKKETWTLPKNEKMCKKIAKSIAQFIRDNHIDEDRLLGVGITFPGVIDPDRDEIILSPTLHMKGTRLSSLREHIAWPLHVENDSTSGGLAEWFVRTSDERDRSYVYLFLGNGIGGAAFLSDIQYQGDHFRSCEFGHMCVVPGGRACNCGKRGCLEAYCSAFRITSDLKVTQDQFFAAVRKGNQRYRKIWDDMLEHLSIAVNNLRMAFDCDVVIGGFLAKELEEDLDALQKKAASLSPFEDDTDYIRIGKLGANASMMGGACHFINTFLNEV